MHFILSPPSFYKKTVSLTLRVRVAELRLGNILFGLCSVPVRNLFGFYSEPVRFLSRSFSAPLGMIYGR